MEVIHVLQADLSKPGSEPVLHAMQHDGVRKIAAQLYDGTAVWEVPEGVTAGIGYTLPNRQSSYYEILSDGTAACTTVENTVTAVLAPVLTSIAGEVRVSIIFTKDDTQLSTFPFRIRVAARPGELNPGAQPDAASPFVGKLYYGGNSGFAIPLGMGDGVRVEQNEDGSLWLVVEGGSGGGISTETASNMISKHNSSNLAHSDIRLLIEGLTTRFNALANSDDVDLDQLAEIVAYIKSNKSLIDAITTSKVSVSDIVDNLVTNVSNKPLSAAQGVALKALVDAIPAWAMAASKPTYTAEEVGADPAGMASVVVAGHNVDRISHEDIRQLVQALTDRLNALANSTDEDLDQLAEIVAYIKSNKSLIDAITTTKVNVADIVDNVVTNVSNKPLSAAMGVGLASDISSLRSALAGYQPKGDYALSSAIPTKVSQLQNDSGYLTKHQDISGKADKAGLSLEIHTDGLLYLFIDGSPVGVGIELPSGGISSYVDAENNIVITGLPDGSYTVKYEMEDGSTIDIGSLVLAETDTTSRLPAEYQEVEWVQINNATGMHSGIKTDLSWSGVDKIVAKVQNVESANTKDMFFSTWVSDSTKSAPYIGTVDGNICGKVSGLTGYAVTPDDVAMTNIDANTFTMTWDSVTSDGIIFFGSWQDLPYSNPHKWYFVEFYNDGALVGEFIPCYRVADNVIGFYDLTRNEFYENAYSSEVFLKGADVVNGGSTEPDESETSYTNLIPTSTELDGTPYNGGTGWKTGYRLNSSGGETAEEGTEVTGCMPFTANDTIYCKGIVDSGVHAVALYDGSYNKLWTYALSNLDVAFDGSTVSFNLQAGLSQALTTDVQATIRYLRICADTIDGNSILTVNEPIE